MANGMRFDREVELIEELYVVGDALGAGSFAVVRRGTCLADGTEWALKVIPLEVYERARHSIELEVACLKRVKHPNVLSLREVVHSTNAVTIVTELCEGGDAFDRLVELETYSEREAAWVIKQTVQAVAHCHMQRVAHRDLKPDNILFSRPAGRSPSKSSLGDGAVKLADFGFATSYGRPGERLYKSLGTPEYVAPEVLREPPYTHRADMWSVGAVTFVLLHGFPPFFADTDQEVFERVKRGQINSCSWQGVSAEAQDFCSRLLTVDENKRMTSLQALHHPWLADMNHSSNRPETSLGPLRSIREDLLDFSAMDAVQSRLARFNAIRKFRKGIWAVAAVARLRNIARTD